MMFSYEDKSRAFEFLRRLGLGEATDEDMKVAANHAAAILEDIEFFMTQLAPKAPAHVSNSSTYDAKRLDRALNDLQRATLDDRAAAALKVAVVMPSYMMSHLRHIVSEGPVWDGDVPSKRGRDELLRTRLVTRCIVNGKEGFTAANYLGYAVAAAAFDREELHRQSDRKQWRRMLT